MPATLQEIERIQRIVARIIAMSPAGVNLLLIGGFRYRLLDRSQRFSADIDYHWGGDLDAKQQELLRLCRRVIIGQVGRELGYEGSASVRHGPEADSPSARFLDLRFWKKEVGAIEVPIELTTIQCLDSPVVRTAEGIVHVTASDADLIESKILAIFNRIFLQHRDLLDLFLHGNNLQEDSPARLRQKIRNLHLNLAAITRRLKDLEEHRAYHAGAIQKVIEEQMDPTVVQQMNAGGGGAAVLETALAMLEQVFPR